MAKISPCCGRTIQWLDFAGPGITCSGCGARFTRSGLLQHDEPFRLLGLAEHLRIIADKIELQLATSAVVNYLEACRDALNDSDEQERRILRDAIDVLVDNWPDAVAQRRQEHGK